MERAFALVVEQERRLLEGGADTAVGLQVAAGEAEALPGAVVDLLDEQALQHAVRIDVEAGDEVALHHLVLDEVEIVAGHPDRADQAALRQVLRHAADDDEGAVLVGGTAAELRVERGPVDGQPGPGVHRREPAQQAEADGHRVRRPSQENALPRHGTISTGTRTGKPNRTAGPVGPCGPGRRPGPEPRGGDQRMKSAEVRLKLPESLNIASAASPPVVFR